MVFLKTSYQEVGEKRQVFTSGDVKEGDKIGCSVARDGDSFPTELVVRSIEDGQATVQATMIGNVIYVTFRTNGKSHGWASVYPKQEVKKESK